MAETTPPPLSAKRAATISAFALGVVLLDMIGLGLILPVLPPLIEDVGGIGLDAAAQVGGFMFAVFSLAQFLCAPALGALSDRIGRRPLLLVAVGGLAIDYVLHALAPSLLWLFLGRLIAGICGSSYVVANACLADVTPPEKRAKAFGLIGAALGLGFILGPALGGLLGEFGPRVPFWVAAALSAANFLFGLVVLPETLPADQRRPFLWREANPLGVLLVFRRYPGVLPWALVTALYFVGSSIYPAIWPFWGMAKFDWTATTTGLTLAVAGLGMALLQGLGTGPAVARWGERPLALVGLALSSLSCLAFGLATATEIVLVLLVVHAFEGFAHPSLSALMSRAVPANAQGALQGGVAALQSLSMLVGTVLFTQVFGYFLTPEAPVQSPDVAFFMAAAVVGLGLLLFVATNPEGKVPEPDPTPPA
jgi:DHA1 family tetracycline resistance protein-like MFS transporter